MAACAKPPVNIDPQAYALIGQIGQQELVRRPQEAAGLGVSQESFGARYDMLLDDRSMAAIERSRVQHLSDLEKLQALDPANLSPAARRQTAIAMSLISGTVQMERFGYGSVGLGWARPYMVEHLDGAYLETPRFLATRHPIASRADADAWLARLRLLDDALIADNRRLQSDFDQGVLPPRTILNRTLATVRAVRPSDPRTYFLLIAFRDQLAALKDLPPDEMQRYLDEAALIVRNDVAPAYDNLIRMLESAAAKAGDDPGVARLPHGEEWYAGALKLYTDSDMTADQLHSLGLSLVKEISDEMNQTLVETERTEGTVGQRMQALAADPTQQFADTEEGRAALLTAVDERIRWANDRIGRFTSARPAGQLLVRPTTDEAGLPQSSSYYAPGGPGGRPAVFYVDVDAALQRPMFALPTLVYRETAPGYHLQASAAQAASGAPMLQTLAFFAAYREGWSVYAEDLASEMGAYDTDAAGRLAYLQSTLLDAARLVADTGLHSKHWSRDQAIDYLVSTTGLSRAPMEDEVDREIVWPGRACADMAGREKIRALRDDADSELGQNFDLKSFNDAVLAGGARPLPILEADLREWTASHKPAAAPPAAK